MAREVSSGKELATAVKTRWQSVGSSELPSASFQGWSMAGMAFAQSTGMSPACPIGPSSRRSNLGFVCEPAQPDEQKTGGPAPAFPADAQIEGSVGFTTSAVRWT